MPRTTDPDLALSMLREGNARFVTGVSRSARLVDQLREHASGQRPFAIVLGCSDSRVPAEFVFDQGIGDLFVIRIAGNIVAPSQIGSVEFAATNFGTALVVVLGHTGCGAIQATLSAMEDEGANPSAGIRAIVDRIAPAIEGLPASSRDEVSAVRANVLASMAHLQTGSQIIAEMVDGGHVRIVGAVYDIHTGRVDFLEKG